jgi:hypothetical protein
MTDNLLKTATKISYVSLATIPLFKENINSALIILCVFFIILNIIKSKSLQPFKKEYWILTSMFWIFLIHETISFDFNFDRVLRNLPFLIFPLLFIYRPYYIDEKIKEKSLLTFQLSVLLQCFIYLLLFLNKFSINKLFYVSPENIPFFREYVSLNYIFEIHPTYFSSFLLVSYTISTYYLLFNKFKKSWFSIINTLLMVFFILLFSSKIVLIILFMTIIISITYYIVSIKSKKRSIIILISSFFLLISLIYPFRDILKERFDEVRTEINKPIVGSYYNSTNTRVAILKCSMILLKQVPLWGFGDSLQERLNDCYGTTNDSDFYKISTFNTHNYYINIVLYGGWISLVVFLIFIFILFRKLKFY